MLRTGHGQKRQESPVCVCVCVCTKLCKKRFGVARQGTTHIEAVIMPCVLK